MSAINIRLNIRLTKEQKELIVKELSDILFKVVGRSNKNSYYLVFDENDGESGRVNTNTALTKEVVSLKESLYFFTKDY